MRRQTGRGRPRRNHWLAKIQVRRLEKGGGKSLVLGYYYGLEGEFLTRESYMRWKPL